MERCVYKHVYNFLLENSIITPHQSGFTPINQLLSLTNEFGKALDEGNSHLVDHAWIVTMSLFNIIADSRGLSTITYKLVSSENNFIDE
jgi:hypothetical protein